MWRPRATATDKDGRFTLYDVVPGNYVVRALAVGAQVPGATTPAPATWATSDVAVSGSNVAVSLTMQPAMTITGRVVFDGASAPPADPTLLNIRLVPAGSGGNIGSGPLGGMVGADRAFSFFGVTPADYRIVLMMRTHTPWDWWPRSAMANGQDVFDGPLRIGPGDKTELVLTYTDRPTELTGQFEDAAGRPAPDYFIVVFPADRSQRMPGSRRILSTRPDNSGRFTVRGLPPGEYLLAALTDVDSEDLNTPSFFEQLVGPAVRVSLAEGRTTTQDLKIGR